MPKSPIARLALIAALVTTLAAFGYIAARLMSRDAPGVASVVEVSSSGTVSIGGPFELVDQTGQRRSDADFRGQYMLIFFGYTYCPDICPTALQVITTALDEIEDKDPAVAAQITPVFVSVDPERDTVEALADYASHFHPRLVALTGTPQEIDETAKAYRVYYKKAGEGEDYLVDHSGFIYVMGPDGAYHSHFSHNTGASEMAAKLTELLEGS
jgi:protein SCO1/2